ncbi:MAG: hypothetical protein FWG53_10165 [Clostridiales bacterium]|nr:hypothetical protein [Clostridiales bacterium]
MDILDLIDWINYCAEALLGAVFALICFRQAGKFKGARLFFLLLAGFFGCVFMSDVFYMLTWIIEDFPFVFSAGDISWIGGYLFLITAALSLTDEWVPEQREAVRKYRWPALAGPAVCVIFNVVFISLYPQLVVNYLLYAVPTAILLYLSLWLFLLSRKGGLQPGLRLYHLAVLVWLSLQMVCDLFSTLRLVQIFAALSTVFWYIVMFIMPSIYFAARKGIVE